MYDEYFWLGMAVEIDKGNEDVLVRLMHPHFPIRSFMWPDQDDVCWVSHLQIVSTAKEPTLSITQSLQYTFDSSDHAALIRCIKAHNLS